MRTLTLILATLTIAGCSRPSDKDRAVAEARALYQRARSSGMDMSRGPCLGEVLGDWAVDVAHNPRQPVDDDPANQCESYRSGRAHHFVELDPEGNLIRAQ